MIRPTSLAGLFCLLLLWIATGSGCSIEQRSAGTNGELLQHAESISYQQEKNYHGVRFEGLKRSEAAMRMIPYLRKYKNKRHNTFGLPAGYYHQCLTAATAPPDIADTAATVTMAFLGDIMWTGRPHRSLLSPDLQIFLACHDLVIGNLETPLDTLRRVKSVLPDYIRYNSNGKLMDAFSDSSGTKNLLSVVSLANNHALDMGGEGLLRTFQVLEARNIEYVGAHRKDPDEKGYRVLKMNGFSLGFCAATWGLNQLTPKDTALVYVNRVGGIAPAGREPVNMDEIRDQLYRMEQEGVDLKIVLLHWGYEYEYFPDSLIRKLAIDLVLAGADLVIGHHPHVVQPIELVYLNGYTGTSDDTATSCPQRLSDPVRKARKALICYSAGNFLSRMYTSECQTGIVVPVTIYRNQQTGRADWSLLSPAQVTNKVPLLPGKKHRVGLGSRD